MDKILSARIEASVVNRIGWLARRLRTSKKKVIESAIEVYASKVYKEQELDAFEETCGVWRRRESPARLVETTRKAFRNSMERHRGGEERKRRNLRESEEPSRRRLRARTLSSGIVRGNSVR